MLDQPLDRPGRRVAKGADGVAFDLLGDLMQHVDIGNLGIAGAQLFHHAPHPARAFAARCALTAALMLVEIADAADGLHDVGRAIHDDDRCRAKTGADRFQPVEIHRRVHDLLGGHQWNRRAAGNDGQQIVPTAANTAAMLFDQIAERNAHRLFDDARPFDMPADLIELGAVIVLTAEAREPGRSAAQDRRHHRNALDIVHRRRAAIKTGTCREWWLEAGLTLFAFKALDHRGFFTADIGACTAVQIDVEIIAGLGCVLADQACIIGLRNRSLHDLCLANIFTADVDIGGARAHSEAGDQRTFDQLVRIVAQNLAVLAAARLGLIGIDDEKAGTTVLGFLGHERPFETSREACPAATAQARRLHLLDDLVLPALDQRLGIIPITARFRRLQAPILEAVDIGENPVLVGEKVKTHAPPPMAK